ncbi:uncharacterized protein BYT42DRAFT_594245 [Radiomyces spectabilis]|uniref:uncharacterized protein n=1 Tax=Radiomyces spectabilis TaxID=64574 RepID=UPI00222029EC|nr:uncharacterized protein BYT42DRAFT_594245 [Radiomyces spectabilis]KAI8376296.1 hypothetical protein BYT42DRAFT_594245 [Radiomyces spectabilis]
MLESLVASILNRFLGNYVSNLNYDQLKIGIWNGEVNLRDLKLRREALDKLDLPIDVIEGYLGELTLSIPWSNLKSKPVKTSVEEEEERAQQLKMRRLATAEVMESSQVKDKKTPKDQDEPQDDGFVSQLTTKIVDNLQFSMKNIHIRYEDSISDPGHPFAAGITLKELSAVSTDGEWNPTFINEATNTIHKLTTLQSLSVYWNTDTTSLAGKSHEEASKVFTDLIPTGEDDPSLHHQYILKPVSGAGKVQLNKKFDRDTAKFNVTLLFNELDFALDDDQYRDVILMLDLFHANLKKQKYLKLHPPKEMTPKTNPREYFQFAAKAVLSEIHERNYKWSWDHFRKRRDQRLTYIDCYVARKLQKSTQEQITQLDELERWFSSWWSSGSKNDSDTEQTDDDAPVMTEEQKRELYDAIEYDEEKAAIAATVDIPKDTMKFILNTKLNRGSFTLRRRPHAEHPENLASIVFDTVTVGVTQYVESLKIAAGLGDIQLYDGASKDTLYPQLIGVKKSTQDQQERCQTLGEMQRGRRHLNKARRAIPSRSSTINALMEVAGDTIEVFKRQTRAGLEYALEKHTTIELDINMDAPIIIIPESCMYENSPFMMIDAGHINVDSDLANQELVNEFKAKGDQKYSEEDYRQLEGLMYDKFNVHLTQTKVLIGTNVKQCVTELDQPTETSRKSHVIERIDMQFLVELCILPGATQFTKFKVSGHLPLLSINFSDSKYKTLMKIIDLFVAPTSSLDTDGEDVAKKSPLENENALAQRLWGNSDMHDLLLSDTDSFTTERSHHSTAASTNSTNKSTVSNASVLKSQQEQFKFTFQVDKVSAFVHETTFHDTTTTDTLLCQLVLENFDLMFLSRPYDMQVEVCLRTLNVIDHMEHGDEFHYLVTSDVVDHRGEAQQTKNNLVNVKYLRVNPAHPLYEESFGGFDQTVDVALSTLNVIVTRPSILTLYNWILNTFTAPPPSQEDAEHAEHDDHSSLFSRRLSLGRPKSIQKPPPQKANNANQGTIKVNLQMDSLDLILNNNGMRLGTGQLAYGHLTILLFPKTMKVMGKFSSFSLVDDTDIDANNHDTSDSPSQTHILSIEGDELLSFTYETLDAEAPDFPGYHQQFRMRMGSFRFLFIDSAKTTLDFLSEFLQMKTVYDAARGAAAETAQQLQEQSTRFHFDIGVKSPVVVFPVADDENMDDTIIAYLGEIRAVNSFKDIEQLERRDYHSVSVPVNVIECGLYSISLRSHHAVQKENQSMIVRDLPILEDLDLTFHIQTCEQSDKAPGPSTRILGTVSNVGMALTEHQLCSLLKVYNRVMHFLFPSREKENKEDQTTTEDQERHSVHTDRASSRRTYQRQDSDERRSSTTAKPDNGNKIQLEMVVKVDTIAIEALTGPELPLEKRDQQKLSRLSFNDTSMKLQTMADASMTLEVQMLSMNFSDTRVNSHSQFRDILPANRLDGPQFQFKLISAKENGQPTMDIWVAVDSPRIVLSLDYLFLLKEFFMTPFVDESPVRSDAQRFAELQREQFRQEALETPSVRRARAAEQAEVKAATAQQRQQQSAASAASNPSSSTNASQLRYRVQVVDVEVICLAKPEQRSSEAVIFSFDQLSIVQQQDLRVDFIGIGMVLCRMDIREESTSHFVEEFGVGLKLETSASTPGHNIMVIQLDVQPIILRLSYHDTLLIMEIINKAMELMGNAASQPSGQPPLLHESMNDDDVSGLQHRDSGSDYPHDDPRSPLQVGANSSELIQSTRRSREVTPYIVMSKESLIARFQGLQLVLIEDLHDLPFIDLVMQPFTVQVKDWSRALVADVDFSIYANNFNFKNSHWEPLLEPWGFGLKLRQDAALRSMHVNLESETLLNLNLTHVFLESILAISETLNDVQPLRETSQKQVRPYVLKNYTGYPLRLWNMSDDAEEGDTRIVQLDPGQSLPWTFRDWKKRREKINVGKNLLGIQVEQFGWESFTHIAVDKEGEHAYKIQPEVHGIAHRLVVDIRLDKHVKTVIFRSGFVFQNQTQASLQLVLVNAKRKMMSPVWTIEAHDEFAVPIGMVYEYWFAVRPSDEYHWSKQILQWSDITHPKCPKYIVCEPHDTNLPNFYFQLYGKFDRKSSLARQYPFMTVQLSPPIQIENLLPFSLDLKLKERNIDRVYEANVPKGETTHMYHITSGSNISFDIQVQCGDDEIHGSIDIQTKAYDASMAQPLTLFDNMKRPWYLCMNTARLTKTSDALKVTIFAPYLILNKTSLPLTVKPRASRRNAKSIIEIHDAGSASDEIVPIMFSYPELNRHNRALLSMDGSKWSQPLSFEAVGSVQEVTLATDGNVSEIHAGIRVEEGTGMYWLTKLVSIAPRFILKNNLSLPIEYREFGSTENHPIDPGQKMPLYHMSKTAIKWLCLHLKDSDYAWSAPFDLQEIGNSFIKVDRGESEPLLVKINIHLQDATLFISFQETKEWPYMIINNSSVPVSFFQEELGFEEYHLKDKQKKALGTVKRLGLDPGRSLRYSWDMPISRDKRLMLEVNGKKRSINFQAIGTQIPFRYRKQRDSTGRVVIGAGALSIDIVAWEASLVLVLTDFDPTQSLFRLKSSAASTLGSSSREGSVRDMFETVDVEHTVNFEFELKLAGIGLSVVNQKVQEIAFATMKDVDFKYTDSNMYQSIRTSIRWLQIDNQFHGSTYPILFFPTTLPKHANNASVHPTLHMALDKVKDDMHGVLYFKLFSILLQEMTFEMDEDFLYGLLEFAQFPTVENQQQPDNHALVFSKAIPEPEIGARQAIYYFEEFCIQPMRLNLSFMRTERVNAMEATESASGSPFSYVFNIFTMTIGNVNDAPIKLNALMVDNLRASSADLTSRIMLHYRDQVIYQVHKVLGSADFLGNPVGLFSNLSSGFGELFYEPYQGFIMSDRPQDLGIGIARGVGGFMKKSVFGLTDSVSRITGSLGKGLSAATMDKKFQDRRRMNLTRNKPRHAMYGVTQGVTYLGTSVASGVAGLVKRPMEGAETGGVVGFAAGLGKGVVG